MRLSPYLTLFFSRSLSRAVIVTEKCLSEEESDNALLGTVPPKVLGNPHPITIFQADDSLAIAPEGTCTTQFPLCLDPSL